MRSLKLSEITGSLSELAREGLREPVVVTRRGRPIVAVMPLNRFDDAASVALATNRKFLEIIERSRASVRQHGTLTMAQVRKRVAAKAAAARRRRSSR